MGSIDVAVARQPIVDRAGDLYGYELLFREVDQETARRRVDEVDGDLMTSTVVFSSLAIGVDRLVGGSYLFCNADVGLLTGSVPLLLPPERTVIEVLETVVPGPAVLAGCRALAAQGYTLALDDFEWFDGCEELVELASIIKIDVQAVRGEALIELVARCRAYDVVLLAEKVETQAELELCRGLGFELFQGYLFSRPRLVPGRTLGSTAPGRLHTAARLVGRDLELEELERLVRADPAATYQLLRLASIGDVGGTRRRFHTLRQALVMVGARRLQNLFLMLTLSGPGARGHDGVVAALTRARMVELLACAHDPPSVSLSFTAGMVSAFDHMLGVPAAQVQAELQLGDELREAAFGDGAPLARLVRDVVDHQEGRPHRGRSGLSVDQLDVVALDALVWALELVGEMQGAAAPAG